MKKPLNAVIPTWLETVKTVANTKDSMDTIRVRGLEIDCWASEASMYPWLLEYLSPLPQDAPCKTQLKFRLGYLVDDNIIRDAIQHIDSGIVKITKIDSGRDYIERMAFGSQLIVDCLRREGVIWITDLDQKTLTVVCANRTQWGALELGRAARELISGYLEDQGWQAFHSGAVRTKKGTFLIIGNSGAGKTSLILSLISAGAQFIANERIYIKVIDNEVHALSSPMPIAIGLGSAVQYSQIREFIRHPEYCLYPPRRMNTRRVRKTPEHQWPGLSDKIQLLPNEMTSAFNAPSSLVGDRVCGIVVPNITAKQPLAAEQLTSSEAREIIGKNYFSRGKGDYYPAWMPFPFGLPDRDQRNLIVNALSELPAARFDFFASSGRQNEMQLYSGMIEEVLGL